MFKRKGAKRRLFCGLSPKTREVSHCHWKVAFLAEKYPQIFALIDNEIHTPLHHPFQGYLFKIKRTKWDELKKFLEEKKMK